MLGGLNRQGHWGAPIDNLSLLLAMSQYFRQYEADAPDFARPCLAGRDPGGERRIPGTVHRRPIGWTCPWPGSWSGTRNESTPSGTARAGCTTGWVCSMCPRDIRLDSLDRGFTVLRTFAPIDDERDVWQDADGAWHVRLGARVRVETTLVTPGPPDARAVVGVRCRPAWKPSTRPWPVPSRSRIRTWTHPGAAGGIGVGTTTISCCPERALINSARLYGGVYSYAVIAEATTAGNIPGSSGPCRGDLRTRDLRP